MSYSLEHLRTFARLCIGRHDDYAHQRGDGRYTRLGCPLTYEVLRLHLEGVHTIGTYVINERGLCRFAAFDADSEHGLVDLLALQARLQRDRIASYIEGSRRGGHLHIFLASPTRPDLLRRWLMPYYPGEYRAGVMEFYPSQDAADGRYGSLLRVPLGVHRLTGRRYPFVSLQGEKLVPVARTVGEALSWLSTVERSSVPASFRCDEDVDTRSSNTHTHTLQKNVPTPKLDTDTLTIRDWCAGQDALSVIGRYVSLDENGLGCCPFGWHHSDGRDTHPSLWVYTPASGDVACWYCHVWKRGGSLFDFLRYYYNLEPRMLWHRILSGEQF